MGSGCPAVFEIDDCTESAHEDETQDDVAALQGPEIIDKAPIFNILQYTANTIHRK